MSKVLIDGLYKHHKVGKFHSKHEKLVDTSGSRLDGCLFRINDLLVLINKKLRRSEEN